MPCRFITRDHMKALARAKVVGGSIIRIMLLLDEIADENGVATYTYDEMLTRYGYNRQPLSQALNRLEKCGIIKRLHGVCQKSKVQFVGVAS